IQGSPGAPTTIDAPVVIGHAARVTLQNLTLRGGLTLRGATEVTLNGCTVGAPGLTLDSGRDIQIVHSVIDAIGTGLTLTGGVSGAVVEHDEIAGTGAALAVTGGGATGLTLRDSHLRGGGSGLALLAPAGGRIAGNEITAAGTGLDVSAAFG